ncbi:MAG: aspartate carbamoyltransferase catalytic subunit [Halobacteriales archaeon]|jgi:aspartate carbamoyltransferase catalytic subunit
MSDATEFKGRDIVSLKDFSRADVEKVLDVAEEMDPVMEEERETDLLKNKILGTCFFEKSTRTRISHESAMHRLGGDVNGFADASVTRAGGWRSETVDDTLRMMDYYSSAIVLRHPDEGMAEHAADIVDVPVLNGGDGGNEHPTQAMLDMYTMRKEHGSLDGLKVALVGDLAHERTYHSLGYGLSNFDVDLQLVYPQGCDMRQEVHKELRKADVIETETHDMDEVIDEADVIYTDLLRKEEFEEEEYERLLANYYQFTPAELRDAKDDAILLQPLPRTFEYGFQITPPVDDLPQATYFEQARNGVVARMALLGLVLKGNDVLEHL